MIAKLSIYPNGNRVQYSIVFIDYIRDIQNTSRYKIRSK